MLQGIDDLKAVDANEDGSFGKDNEDLNNLFEPVVIAAPAADAGSSSSSAMPAAPKIVCESAMVPSSPSEEEGE